MTRHTKQKLIFSSKQPETKDKLIFCLQQLQMKELEPVILSLQTKDFSKMARPNAELSTFIYMQVWLPYYTKIMRNPKSKELVDFWETEIHPLKHDNTPKSRRARRA